MFVRSLAATALLLFLVGGGGAGCAGTSSEDDTTASESDLTTKKLDVVSQSRLPLVEVSGLGARTVGGKTSYLAIGDAKPILITFDVGSNGKPQSVRENDLSELFGNGASQWEAVAGDKSGRVFILDEGHSIISVVDKGLTRIEHKIKLTMPSDHPLSHAWERDANSRGEGMLLLSNGHILLVKEKDPVAIIEFAPKRAAPAGYDASLALGTRAFDVPSGATSEMVPAAYWELKSSNVSLLGDVSEIALDFDGRILLLSDQSRAIARVERGLRPDEDKVDLKALYELPRAVSKPEGLILVNGKPLVAIDIPDADEDSLFQIEALPAPP